MRVGPKAPHGREAGTGSRKAEKRSQSDEEEAPTRSQSGTASGSHKHKKLMKERSGGSRNADTMADHPEGIDGPILQQYRGMGTSLPGMEAGGAPTLYGSSNQSQVTGPGTRVVQLADGRSSLAVSLRDLVAIAQDPSHPGAAQAMAMLSAATGGNINLAQFSSQAPNPQMSVQLPNGMIVPCMVAPQEAGPSGMASMLRTGMQQQQQQQNSVLSRMEADASNARAGGGGMGIAALQAGLQAAQIQLSAQQLASLQANGMLDGTSLQRLGQGIGGGVGARLSNLMSGEALLAAAAGAGGSGGISMGPLGGGISNINVATGGILGSSASGTPPGRRPTDVENVGHQGVGPADLGVDSVRRPVATRAADLALPRPPTVSLEEPADQNVMFRWMLQLSTTLEEVLSELQRAANLPALPLACSLASRFQTMLVYARGCPEQLQAFYEVLLLKYMSKKQASFEEQVASLADCIISAVYQSTFVPYGRPQGLPGGSIGSPGLPAAGGQQQQQQQRQYKVSDAS